MQVHVIKAATVVLSLLSILTSPANAGRYDELAAWAKQDCDDYAQLVKATNAARNAHEVALTMNENVRRQRQTIKTLLLFARSHPDLRDAAQLGLDKEGQLFWREQHPDRTALPAEVSAIESQIKGRNDAVDAKGHEQMISILRKYNRDPEVLTASRELREMWAENRRKLLEALR